MGLWFGLHFFLLNKQHQVDCLMDYTVLVQAYILLSPMPG